VRCQLSDVPGSEKIGAQGQMGTMLFYRPDRQENDGLVFVEIFYFSPAHLIEFLKSHFPLVLISYVYVTQGTRVGTNRDLSVSASLIHQNTM
jgi:hypothetical protein